MDRHAYHTFQILDHVEKTPVLTNRRVASKLNVSVRLAHGLLSKLVQKGLLHIRKRHARRWDYFLTPSGVAEKARLTYEFLDFTMQFYREARRRSAEALARLRKGGVKEIAFLGASDLAEIAFLGVREHKLKLAGVYDDAKAGGEFLGLKVRAVARLREDAPERVLVTAFDPALPMRERYLPAGAEFLLGPHGGGPTGEDRLVWVFGRPPAGESDAGSDRGEAG